MTTMSLDVRRSVWSLLGMLGRASRRQTEIRTRTGALATGGDVQETQDGAGEGSDDFEDLARSSLRPVAGGATHQPIEAD
jgi:hypothetical protein